MAATGTETREPFFFFFTSVVPSTGDASDQNNLPAPPAPPRPPSESISHLDTRAVSPARTETLAVGTKRTCLASARLGEREGRILPERVRRLVSLRGGDDVVNVVVVVVDLSGRSSDGQVGVCVGGRGLWAVRPLFRDGRVSVERWQQTCKAHKLFRTRFICMCTSRSSWWNES